MPVYYAYPTRPSKTFQGWKISVLSAGIIALVVFSTILIISFVKRDREPTTQRWFRSKSQIRRSLALSQVFDRAELGSLGWFQMKPEVGNGQAAELKSPGWFGRKSRIETPAPVQQSMVFEKEGLPGDSSVSLGGGKAGKVLGF